MLDGRLEAQLENSISWVRDDLQRADGRCCHLRVLLVGSQRCCDGGDHTRRRHLEAVLNVVRTHVPESQVCIFLHVGVVLVRAHNGRNGP